MQILLTAALVLLPTFASAVDFIPQHYGIVITDRRGKPEKPPVYCVPHGEKHESAFMLFECNDGSTRYGKENLWEEPISETPKEMLPFDASVKVPGYTLLRVEGYINDSYARRQGRRTKTVDRYILSFSYLLVPDQATCEKLAPKIAYQQYVSWQKHRKDIEVQYFCD